MSERMPRRPLEAAVASAVGRGTGAHVALAEVERDGIDYDAFLAHRAVHRIRGTALLDGDPVAWSLVEKVTEGPAFATPYLYDNAARELAAYRSGLLARLAPRLRGPRLYGSQLDADGRITLWLSRASRRRPSTPGRRATSCATTTAARRTEVAPRAESRVDRPGARKWRPARPAGHVGGTGGARRACSRAASVTG